VESFEPFLGQFDGPAAILNPAKHTESTRQESQLTVEDHISFLLLIKLTLTFKETGRTYKSASSLMCSSIS
jgi:hypothetical protein